MRGKVELNTDCLDTLRITPAHAGKSLSVKIVCLSIWDHPRTCGEKSVHATFRKLTLGSPPHMRGKGMKLAISRDNLRITPAHAGKRCPISPQQKAIRDHPRTCGEKNAATAGTVDGAGSPPHMRGKA